MRREECTLNRHVRFYKAGSGSGLEAWQDQQGVIVQNGGSYVHVLFDLVISGNREWACFEEDLHPVHLSPEEEAAYQAELHAQRERLLEEKRKEEERAADQQRRHEHAMKWL